MAKRSLIAILGLGVFGRTLAKTLADYDVDVIAIDKNEQIVNDYSDYFYEAVIGDITDHVLLENVGIRDCQAAVVATGSNLEASSIAFLHLNSFGIPTIVCKASTRSFAQILRAVGATDIIMPEKDSGRLLAKSLVQENIKEVLDLDQETSLINFIAPDKWVGRTLDDLDLRNRHQINIIGYREKLEKPINTDVTALTTIVPGMILVAIAKNDTIEALDFLNAL